MINEYVEYQDQVPAKISEILFAVRNFLPDAELRNKRFDSAINNGLRYMSLCLEPQTCLEIYVGKENSADRYMRRIKVLPATRELIESTKLSTGLPRWKVTTLAIHFSRTCKMGSIIAEVAPYMPSLGLIRP